MHETSAYQNDQVIYLNPFDWYIITGASVPSFDRMLGELEVAFGL
jgi:ABC-type enterochelin transport system substrate-binding protein